MSLYLTILIILLVVPVTISFAPQNAILGRLRRAGDLRRGRGEAGGGRGGRGGGRRCLSTTADSEAALLKTLRSLISETGQIGVDADESLAAKIESVCGEVSH